MARPVLVNCIGWSPYIQCSCPIHAQRRGGEAGGGPLLVDVNNNISLLEENRGSGGPGSNARGDGDPALVDFNANGKADTNSPPLSEKNEDSFIEELLSQMV
jgi:hypothetical protein